MKENKLPADVREIISIIHTGKMPDMPDVFKYDFVGQSYLKNGLKKFAYGFLIFFGIIFYRESKNYGFGTYDIIFLTPVGIASVYLLIKNFRLYKEAKQGNAYLLLTPIYFVLREGKQFKIYKWETIEGITISAWDYQKVGEKVKYVKWEEINFKYNKRPITLRLNHLKSDTFTFLYNQMLKYKTLYGSTENKANMEEENRVVKKEVGKLQKWFNGLNKKQLILVRIAAVVLGLPLILCYSFGIMIIIVWLYLEFGKEK